MEHVKQANDGIKFNKVVSGVQTFPGLGYNFDLIIDAWNRDGKDGKMQEIDAKSVPMSTIF
ncbi:hypothetical protein EJB05_53300, partial [Eragrostis curvula]